MRRVDYTQTLPLPWKIERLFQIDLSSKKKEAQEYTKKMLKMDDKERSTLRQYTTKLN